MENFPRQHGLHHSDRSWTFNDMVKLFELGQFMSKYNSYVNLWLEVAALGTFPVIVSFLLTINQITMAHCAVLARTAISTLL